MWLEKAFDDLLLSDSGFGIQQQLSLERDQEREDEPVLYFLFVK